MKLPPYNPADLESIKKLCAEGFIPQALLTIRELCRSGKFPAVKVGKDWATTRALVRGHYFKKGNVAFRKMAS